jgi:hypothetical protein
MTVQYRRREAADPIQPRFNLTMRRTVDSGDQWRRQISAQTAAELALRAISCSFGLAAERQGTH